MKNILFSVVIIFILLFISCDRFKHEFSVEELTPFEYFVKSFIEDLIFGLKNNDIASILSYYSDDYLNNGEDKQDVENYLDSLSNITTDSLEIQCEGIFEDSLKFSYSIFDGSVEIDTIFIEYVNQQGDSFQIIGNQYAPVEPQKVLVELFTSTSCAGCPYCEDALHTLMDEYGDKFYYFEYHMFDELDIGNLEIFNYYQIGGSLPTSIFQGQSKIIGGGPDSYQEYKNALLSFFETDASAVLDNLNYEIVSDTLSGTIQIDLIDDIIQDDLYLKYTLIEEVSSVNNYAGYPCRQVVIAKDEEFVGDADFSNLIEFSLELPDNIPDDLILYVWLQTLTYPYDNDTCKIYNVVEEEIILTK